MKIIKHSLIYGILLGVIAVISPIPYDYYFLSAIAIFLGVYRFSKKEEVGISDGVGIGSIIFLLYFIVAVAIKLLIVVIGSSGDDFDSLMAGGLAGIGLISTVTNFIPGVIYAIIVGLVSGAIFKKNN